MDDQDKKTYELAFLLERAEAEAEIAAVLSQFPSAEILQKSPLKDLQLAYPIKKHASLQFGWYHCKALPSDILQIRTALALRPGVVRTLLITLQFSTRQQKLSRRPQPTHEKAVSSGGVQTEPETIKPSQTLSNEELEKKLEEILK